MFFNVYMKMDIHLHDFDFGLMFRELFCSVDHFGFFITKKWDNSTLKTFGDFYSLALLLWIFVMVTLALLKIPKSKSMPLPWSMSIVNCIHIRVFFFWPPQNQRSRGRNFTDFKQTVLLAQKESWAHISVWFWIVSLFF